MLNLLVIILLPFTATASTVQDVSQAFTSAEKYGSASIDMEEDVVQEFLPKMSFSAADYFKKKKENEDQGVYVCRWTDDAHSKFHDFGTLGTISFGMMRSLNLIFYSQQGERSNTT